MTSVEEPFPETSVPSKSTFTATSPSASLPEVAAREVEAEVLEPRGQRVAPGVLAEDELVGRPPDVLGLHDLVGQLLLEHAVLVDARLVGERVLPHDGLVRLDVDAGDVGEQPRG